MGQVHVGPASPGTGFRVPDDPGAARLEQFARVSAELSAAASLEAVIAAALDHGSQAIGASVATIMLAEGDRLRLAGSRGTRSSTDRDWAYVEIDDSTPAGHVYRTGAPVVLENVAAVDREYPALRSQTPAGRSVVCLPMENAPRPVGVIGLAFEQSWVPGQAEMAFLVVFAEACGQAVRRVLASAEAAKREWELAYLAQVSLELSHSLDYESTLAKIADLSVPTLADWCAVDIAADGTPATLAVAHVDPEKVRWARELQRRYPPNYDSAQGVGKVFRTGVSELYREITDEMLAAGAHDEEHLRLSRELNLRSAIVVPIPGRATTLGTLTLIRTAAAAVYGETDLALAEEVGRRAGLAIENARLYGQSQDVALELQRAVLPEALDDLPGWEVAAHYAAGGRDGVGGDFYDAVVLPDGRLAFAIGDVMGHGVRAAAAMAQIRAAVRAYLSLDPDPATVVGNLDMMFERLAITQLVTLLYAVADPAARTLSFTNAGHYPPLLVRAGRQPCLLTVPPRLPLGAGGDERVTETVPLGRSDVLAIFTDGLVERRGEVVDVGLARLVEAAPALVAGRLADRIGALVTAVARDGTHEDDITVMAVRHRMTGP